jgi:hypothetical protein
MYLSYNPSATSDITLSSNDSEIEPPFNPIREYMNRAIVERA